MIIWKTFIFLTFLVFGTANRAKAEIVTEVSAATYEMTFENFGFFMRIGIALKGYDFLEWKEMQIRITSRYDTETSARTITEVSITRDGDKKFFSLVKDGDAYRGGMNIDMPVTFTDEAADAFLNIWNYFFDARTDDLYIDVEPLANEKHSNNFLRCRLKKEKDGDFTLIKSVPLPNLRKRTRIEAIVSSGSQPGLEMTMFQLKGGQIIRLSRKPQ